MSPVSNVLVFSDHVNEKQAQQLKDLGLRDIAQYGPPVEVGYGDNKVSARPADFWGGGKIPEIDLWAGAFNHWDEDDFTGSLSHIFKEHKWPVQCFNKHEYDNQFRLVFSQGLDIEP